MSDDDVLMSRFELGRFQLTRLTVGEGGIQEPLQRLLQITSRTLGVARANLWLLDPSLAEPTFVCVASLPPFEEGELVLRTIPRYAHALSQRRVVAIDDALHDLRSRDLVVSYLAPLGIGALLDAPVVREGQVVGVICHEHTGGPRAWQQRDVDFAAHAADLAALVVEQADRQAAETRLRLAEAALAEARKNEALGRMAAGITHDLNNLLAAIVLHLSLLKRSASLDQALTSAKELEDAVAYARRLVEQLVAYTRRRASRPPEVLDLAAVVREAEPVLQQLVMGAVTLRVRCAPGAVLVLADRSRVEQILSNLVVNARDASPPGAPVLVSLEVDEGGRAAVLTVEDHGAGMDEETRARIFEPFFSTKPSHLGSGLGLAVVHSAVEALEAAIEVRSVVGEGSLFRVTIPLAGARARLPESA